MLSAGPYSRSIEAAAHTPITFAHRGASAHVAGNTLESFRLALRLGATGLESDVRLTSDGVPVLHHDRRVKGGMRRRPVGSLSRARLPLTVLSLEELFAACGSKFELSLDVCDAEAVEPVIDVARAAGDDALGRLWLCHRDWELLSQWRTRFPEVRLVNSTRISTMRPGPEKRAAQLAGAGIDAVNLHHEEWSAGHVALFHRFNRLTFAWDAQHERVVKALVHMGIDGIYGDHVDRLVEAIGAG